MFYLISNLCPSSSKATPSDIKNIQFKVLTRSSVLKTNPVVDQWDLQAQFLAWFITWKIYSECTTLHRI